MRVDSKKKCLIFTEIQIWSISRQIILWSLSEPSTLFFSGTNMQTKERLLLLYNTDQKSREKSRENVEGRQRENE